MKNILLAIQKCIMRYSDKALHFAISYGLVYTLADKWEVNAAVAVGILVGVLKELFDYKTTHKFDMFDILAGVLGIALAFVLFQA